MRYAGWHYEKTLLINSSLPGQRIGEFIDTRIAVRSDRAENIENDVRAVLKKDWNVYDREVPCQVYAIEHQGDVTTFRVAFQVDLASQVTLRVGVLYGNPSAEKPPYQSSLTLDGEGLGFTVDTPNYYVETDPESGQLSLIAIKTQRHEKVFNHTLTPKDSVQPGVSVVFAGENGGTVAEERVSASGWKSPEILRAVRGPLFCSITRRGLLEPKNKLGIDKPPCLEVTYKFFADHPYVLVESKLEFPSDTPVFALRNGELCVTTSMFSHYTFRPVSPSLPLTDVEEMGHVLIDPEYTNDLPESLILGGFLPYDLAWQSFINIHKGPQRKQHGLTSIALEAEDTCADGDPALYRAATYLEREGDRTHWYHGPIYVQTRTNTQNIITVPAGSIYRRKELLFFSAWDIEQWAPLVEQTGTRLNTPPVVEQYPRLLGVEIPREEPESLPQGCRGDAYLRAGVR